MKSHSRNEKTMEETFSPFSGETFRFRCGKDVPCFNECCAKLRLILTPYDILRLKHRLRMSSGRFLEQYTETVFEEQCRFPMVKLRMTSGESGACPFVSPDGCTVYEDRPVACRIYPLGRAYSIVEGRGAQEKFFIVREPHCLGFREDRQWNLKDWMRHEGVDAYNAVNDPWAEIVTSNRSLRGGNPTQKHQMFFMASYNLDAFRKFVFHSKFLDVFHVAPAVKETIRQDDRALLRFAWGWLKFSLFGDKNGPIGPRHPQP